MSERSGFDALFDGLRGAAPPEPFAPAAAVRRRGRPRSRRRAAVAAVALLGLAGLGSGGVAVVLEPTGAAPPDGPAGPAATAPAGIPESWLLAGDELGAGWERTGHELFQGDPPWYWGDLCPEYRAADYRSLRERTDLAAVSYGNESLPIPGRVSHVLERFHNGAGPANLRDVRAVTALCALRPSAEDEVAPAFFEVERTGFAGDESLLIRIEHYRFNDRDEIELAPHFQYVAVVRVGDLVSTTIHGDDADVDRALEIAAAAAARLP